MYLSRLAKDVRRSPREDVSWQTRVNAPDMPPAEVLIVNLSPSGCMVRSDAILVPGEPTMLMLPMVGQTEAQVMWALGGRAGLEFVTPLPLHSYSSILSEMQRDNYER
ncbi:PilZ domain-containing protein [Sphingobium sp. CR28]|uniref:PilZ domain-containing protein n=1 Tax=Sphingobium sp. CR28 TaxID=3400272 RepID=UPI003FED99D3